MTSKILPARSHDALFVEYGFDDACGLVPPGLDGDAAMRGATSPSSNILDGLKRDGLCIKEVALELHRPTHLNDLQAEFDAELFCRELNRRVGQGRLTLGPEFGAFERLWRRDELDHAIGFAKVYTVLYREDERTVLERLRSRKADFTGLEPFLGDELSVCLVLAYDELATTRSYAADWHDFYPQFGDDRLTLWIQRVAADEARHYGNLIRVLRTAHAYELDRAPDVLDAICQRDLGRNQYRGTFVLDHDDPTVFPADRLRECARRVWSDLGPKPS